MSQEITVLVHGFFTCPRDMAYLERGLKKAGFKTWAVRLPTAFGTLQDCVDALSAKMAELEEATTVNFVAHSMGGLVTREYLLQHGAGKVDKCVFIATPHGGTRFASLVDNIPLYSIIFKPIKHFLPGSGYRSFQRDKGFRLGLIAGNKHWSLAGKLLLRSPSDGRVEVESVKTDDADDFVALPFGHKTIHHRQLTLDHVVGFLREGQFPASRQQPG